MQFLSRFPNTKAKAKAMNKVGTCRDANNGNKVLALYAHKKCEINMMNLYRNNVHIRGYLDVRPNNNIMTLWVNTTERFLSASLAKHFDFHMGCADVREFYFLMI